VDVLERELMGTLRGVWAENECLVGLLLFGSRASGSGNEDSDVDIGLVYTGSRPVFEKPDNWDLFLWSETRWKRGFVLQVELAKTARILYDPCGVIEERFKFIQTHILPHWVGYLRRI